MTLDNSVCEFINSISSRDLLNTKSRRRVAYKLSELVGYWSVAEMLLFVDEMRGLDLSKSEDRAVFCEFFFSWLKGVENESSYT